MRDLCTSLTIQRPLDPAMSASLQSWATPLNSWRTLHLKLSLVAESVAARGVMLSLSQSSMIRDFGS